MSLAPTASNDRGAGRATRAVRAGIDRDTAFGAVTPPLVLSSNFSFAGFAQKRQNRKKRSSSGCAHKPPIWRRQQTRSFGLSEQSFRASST